MKRYFVVNEACCKINVNYSGITYYAVVFDVFVNVSLVIFFPVLMSCIKGVEGEIRFVKVFMIILEFCNFWNTESFVSLPVIRNYILIIFLFVLSISLYTFLLCVWYKWNYLYRSLLHLFSDQWRQLIGIKSF